MMVISVCVNDAVLLLYMLLFKSCFGSSCDSHHLLFLMVISVLQRYKTDFSTSIGCYIIIISVNEITVFNCKKFLQCAYATAAGLYFFVIVHMLIIYQIYNYMCMDFFMNIYDFL